MTYFLRYISTWIRKHKRHRLIFSTEVQGLLKVTLSHVHGECDSVSETMQARDFFLPQTTNRKSCMAYCIARLITDDLAWSSMSFTHCKPLQMHFCTVDNISSDTENYIVTLCFTHAVKFICFVYVILCRLQFLKLMCKVCTPCSQVLCSDLWCRLRVIA